MSFSTDVKEELLKRTDNARKSQIAELAAILAACATIRREKGGIYKLILATENPYVVQDYETLIIQLFDVDEEQLDYKADGPKEPLYLTMSDQDKVKKILMAVKWMDPKTFHVTPVFVHDILIQSDAEKKAFLRGLFLACGSITDPNKSYHFELVLTSEEDAKEAVEQLAFFHLDAHYVLRKKSYVVYLKELSQIADALNVCGAYVSQMELMNISILKEMRNNVNRRVNCETANLNKTVEAAVRQIQAIEKIESTIGIENLKSNLQEIARLRIQYPDMSLTDLGGLLDPPVGKSGINHRLRKICEIAEEL